MNNKNNYPKHLFERIRVKIAKNYIKQDFRKILPSIRDEAVWSEIDENIDSWFDTSKHVGSVRDFWNRFYGIAMGGKLKIGLIQILTAENIKWELVNKLPLDKNLASGGGLGYIHEDLNKRRLLASELRVFVSDPKNKKIVEKWQKIYSEQANSTAQRDTFPIIAVESFSKENSYVSVYDGNRRMAQCVMNNKKTIEAYVGRFTTVKKSPKNFWIPTPFLMELVKEGAMTGKVKPTKELLSEIIKYSQSAQFELFERVLVGSNTFKSRLKEELEQKKQPLHT